MDLDELLLGLNRFLQGWANYFRHGVSKRTFNKVDSWRRIGIWLQRQHGRLAWKQVKCRFCDQGWRYARNGVVFTGAASVKVIRYRISFWRVSASSSTTIAAAAAVQPAGLG